MKHLQNRVSLIGHVGQDPEVKTLENGTKLAKVSLATNSYYIDRNGQRVEQTEWHRLTAWGKTADLIENHVHKGSRLAVEGRLQYRKYEDEDGRTNRFAEIRLDEVMLL